MHSFNDYLSPIQNYLDEEKRFNLTSNEENDPLSRAFQYNVTGGKQIRSRMVPLAFRALCPGAEQTRIDLATKIGWAVEVHQAFICVIDDIMDQSETRRGKPCWYRVNNRNLAACNDALYLEHSAYQLLHRFLEQDQELYTATIQLFLNVTYKMTIGENLDMETGVQYDNFDTYTMNKYKYIAKYKTAVYFCYLPICAAMLLAGMRRKNDETSWALVEDICMDIGYFIQVVDDYLDCFGDPEKTGKIGSDIQNGKCTWLFAKAMDICNNSANCVEKWSNLKANYGRSDKSCVEKVKNIFKELEIRQELDRFQNELCIEIIAKIKNLPEELESVGKLLKSVFDGLCDRKM